MTMPPSTREPGADRARHAVVIMGVAGCGKSVVGQALATALHWRFVEGDLLHSAENVARMGSGVPLDDDHRWGWLDAIGTRLAQASTDGIDAIATCSALKRSYRDRLRTFAPSVLFLHLEVDPDTARARVSGRKGHFMSPSLIDSQFDTLERPGADEAAFVLDGCWPATELVERARSLIGATFRDRGGLQ